MKRLKKPNYFFFFQVNGNLVSPMHVLANAEVVEIITYSVSIWHPLYFYFEENL